MLLLSDALLICTCTVIFRQCWYYTILNINVFCNDTVSRCINTDQGLYMGKSVSFAVVDVENWLALLFLFCTVIIMNYSEL